jgi:hypothetical protein
MKRQHKLNSREREEQQEAVLEKLTEQTIREFGSPEELLRHDALHTPVPPAIAHRLLESIGAPAPTARSWWRRLLGQ